MDAVPNMDVILATITSKTGEVWRATCNISSWRVAGCDAHGTSWFECDICIEQYKQIRGMRNHIQGYDGHGTFNV